METEIKSSYSLSREIEGRFKVVNYSVSRGCIATAIGNGQQHNPAFDSISSQYRSLIPLIETLAAKIDSELAEARSRPKEEI